jgi:hypothetical protein
MTGSMKFLLGSWKIGRLFIDNLLFILYIKAMKTMQERLWNRLVSKGECLEWTGAMSPDGYGVIKVRQKQWRAHRLAYTESVGPIPQGMLVCHTCDNILCCNPKHLFLGTPQDNMIDMVCKKRGDFYKTGRIPPGRPSKISAMTIAEIKSRRNSGNYTIVELSQHFGISETHISRLLKK